MSARYYHAGCIPGSGVLEWSPWTYRTRQTAERAAKKLAARHGGAAVIEWWDRSHGLKPKDADAVAGSAEVGR